MIEIQLPKGRVAFVSDEDARLQQWHWHVRAGYVLRREGKQDVLLHREVAMRMSPAMHKDGTVGFYDRNPLNCQRDNLSLKAVRLVTMACPSREQLQALVSPEDFEYLNQWAWRQRPDGYIVRSFDGARLHQIVARRMGLDKKRVRLGVGGRVNCRRENIVA